MANRVVCCLTVSLLMGILFGKYGDFLFLAVFLLFLVSVAIAIIRSQEGVWKSVLIRSVSCILFFCFGFCHFQAALQLRDNLETALEEGERVTVQGKVQKKEERMEQYLYYLTDTQALVDGIVYPSYGVLVYSSNMHIQPGNILKITGTYAPFQISRNEGNFDEKQYYQSKKIEFRLYAQEETVVSKKKAKYAVFLEKMRKIFRNVYTQCMSEKNAGLLADMTLGDKTLLDGEIKTLYQRAGISHILAISGLHISLFGMGVYRLLQRLPCPNKLSALLSVGVVCSFGLLSGMEVSTIRAICMFCMGMAARTFGYSYDSLTALGLSASIQVWENPFILDYTGFLFSYAAVIGVTVIAGILRKPFDKNRENVKSAKEREEKQKSCEEHKKSRRKNSGWKKCLEMFLETIFVSICIQLATLPLSLYFYYEIPCYSILANGCVLSWIGLLLFLAVLGAFAGSIFLPAGKLILTPVGWMLAGNEWVCQKTLDFPGAVFVAGKPEIALILLYYGILIAVLYLLWQGARRRWLMGIAFALGVVLFLREKPQFEIDVLDVGQGDGIFIQTEEGKHFFVDGGSSDVKQVGTYRILPFLKSKGIASIKGWIVSHADQDHISGLKELLEEGYPIEYLIVAKGMVRDEASNELLHMAKEAGCEVVFVTPGMKFGNRNTIFTAWHPKAQETGIDGKGTDRNGASLVVSLEHQGFTGIFTGDIGAEEEQQLADGQGIKAWMESKGIESIDFYKGAHHGSNGSNSQEFLDILSPKLTVVSCGKGNSYGHPGAEALKRIGNTGSRIFCTMEKGQVSIQISKGRFTTLSYCSRFRVTRSFL